MVAILYLLGYTIAPAAGVIEARDVEITIEVERPTLISGEVLAGREIEIAVEVERPVAVNRSLVAGRDIEIAVEVESAGLRAGKVAEGERVLALIVRPYDSMIAQTMNALPVPLGYAPLTAGPEVIVNGAETAAYFSDVGFVSVPADDPPSTNFPGKLQQPYDFEATLFDQGEPAGRSSVSAGTITVINTSGEFDSLLDLGWAGRTIELYRGRKHRPFSSFQEVFRGTCEGISWTNLGITISLRDRQDILRQPLQTAAYGGAGGLDGDEVLAGKLRPQAYGQCLNVLMTVMNAADQVYQFHDRQAEAVLAVRDNGAALTAGVDWPDFDALLAATIAPGSYDTCLALGLVRLGAQPVGAVTADVLGDALGGYVSTAADIVRRMVTTRLLAGQITDPADLDVDSFTALNAAQGAAQQFFASSEEQPDIAEAVDRIMAGIGGYWFFTRRDQLRVGRLEAPAAGGQKLTARDVRGGAVERRLLQRPSRARRVAWGWIWHVQDADALADISEEDKAFYSTRRRIAAASDDAVLTKYRLALDIETPSLFVFQPDAEGEAERLLALHGAPRDLYTVPVVDGLFRFQIGESVNWRYDRFGLQDGRDFIVVGVRENAAAPETVLELWG